MPAPSFTPQPYDLTTDHDGASVRIAVIYPPWQWPKPSASLAQSLSLQKYPEGTPVAASVSQEEPDSSSSNGAFVLHPDAPLAAGWYALVLKAGAGVMYGALKQADGSYASRFRLGSDPLLTGVSACASKTNTELPKVRLDFSEMVTMSSGAPPVQVMVDGAAASCVVYEPPSPGNVGLGLTCTPPIPAAAKLSITVGTGIVSASSALPLHTTKSALPRTFDLPLLGTPYESCRSWHESETPP